MIYIIFFLFSTFFFELGKQFQDKRVRKIIYAVAILIPVFFAMVRGDDVGRDLLGYAKPIFRAAKGYDSFVQFIGYENVEPGFLLIEYIGAHVVRSFSFVLGITELIIIYCVYKTVLLIGQEKYLPFCMYIFYTLFYDGTLNIMRQNIACALVLLSFAYLFNKKYLYSVLCLIFAICFHTTAGVAIILVLVYMLADSDKRYRVINCVIIVSGILMFTLWESVFKKIFLYIPIWQNNYSDYFKFGKKGDFNQTSAICAVIIIIIMYINVKKYNSKWNKLLLSTGIIVLSYLPVTPQLDMIVRLLLYPKYFFILAYPMVRNCGHLKINGIKSYKYMFIGLICFFTFIWYYSVVLNNSNSVIPYEYLGFR